MRSSYVASSEILISLQNVATHVDQHSRQTDVKTQAYSLKVKYDLVYYV